MSSGEGPRFEVLARDVLGQRAAELVDTALRSAVDARGRATLAVSGGSTPGPMFEALATMDVPWAGVRVLQVDERIAPDGDADRNLGDLRRLLLDRVPVPAANILVAPVGVVARDEGSVEELVGEYGATVRDAAGDPPVIDVVHLGLGDDGHTASLVPGDPVLAVEDRAVAVTGTYQGRRRVTLTAPVLRAARMQLWLVAGEGKRAAVERLRAGTGDDPAGSVLTDRAIVLLDPAAAG